jgi:hypothetical protein
MKSKNIIKRLASSANKKVDNLLILHKKQTHGDTQGRRYNKKYTYTLPASRYSPAQGGFHCQWETVNKKTP